MADDQGGAHADMHFLAVEFGLHQFRGLFGNGFQSFNEERGNAGDKFHDRTHGDTQEEHFLDVELCGGTDKYTYDDTQYQRFAQYAELLFHSVGVNVQLGEAGNLVQCLIYKDSERREALAERLGDGDTVQVIVFLELVCCQVGAYKCDDVANDGCEIAPCQAFSHNEIRYGTDEGEVPVVPKVDVHRTGGLRDEHQHVYAQTNRNNQGTYGRVVCHGCRCGPAHVEYVQLQVVKVGDSF